MKIAREGEGIEGKDKGEKGERDEKYVLPLNLPQYSLRLLLKTLSDASFLQQGGVWDVARALLVFGERRNHGSPNCEQNQLWSRITSFMLVCQ